MPQKQCDWNGCSEIGFFDGLDKTRLTNEGKKHISAFLKLIFLCPYHVKLGVGSSEGKIHAPKTGQESAMTRPTWKILEDSRRLRDYSRVLRKEATTAAKRLEETLARIKKLINRRDN